MSLALMSTKDVVICEFLLRHCTASLIMNHPDYVADHDVHFMLPSKLINAVKNFRLATDETTAYVVGPNPRSFRHC
jgi:hypothetical protein